MQQVLNMRSMPICDREEKEENIAFRRVNGIIMDHHNSLLLFFQSKMENLTISTVLISAKKQHISSSKAQKSPHCSILELSHMQIHTGGTKVTSLMISYKAHWRQFDWTAVWAILDETKDIPLKYSSERLFYGRLNVCGPKLWLSNGSTQWKKFRIQRRKET